jgi:hypothetical protein
VKYGTARARKRRRSGALGIDISAEIIDITAK